MEGPYACNCEVKIRIFKIHSNASKHYGLQCERCGRYYAKKKAEINPDDHTTEFDESIWAKFAKSVQLKNEQEVAEREAIRRQQYENYIESDDWKRKRKAILERDGNVCQGCLRATAVDVHHLTYARLRNELAFDLISVCRRCHDKAHGREHVDLSGILNNIS